MTGIVILNYNNIDNTIDCLYSIFRHFPEGSFRICLVDNASAPEVQEAVHSHIETLPPVIHYVCSHENVGYARGNNLGLEYFDDQHGVDSILIVNNDVIFTEDVLTPMTAYMDSHPQVGVVSPLLRTKSGGIDYACARREKNMLDLLVKATSLGRLGVHIEDSLIRENPSLLDRDEVQTELPSGSCMLLRKKIFSSVGYFDPRTFLYFEEDILRKKLKAKGFQSVLLPRISAIHLGAQSTAKSAGKFIYGCYRDSMLHYMEHYTDIPAFVRKYISWRTALALKFKR